MAVTAQLPIITFRHWNWNTQTNKCSTILHVNDTWSSALWLHLDGSCSQLVPMPSSAVKLCELVTWPNWWTASRKADKSASNVTVHPTKSSASFLSLYTSTQPSTTLHHGRQQTRSLSFLLQHLWFLFLSHGQTDELHRVKLTNQHQMSRYIQPSHRLASCPYIHQHNHLLHYTMAANKLGHFHFYCSIFGFCWPIYQFYSLLQLREMISAYIWNKIYHLTLTAIPQPSCYRTQITMAKHWIP